MRALIADTSRHKGKERGTWTSMHTSSFVTVTMQTSKLVDFRVFLTVSFLEKTTMILKFYRVKY